MKGATIASRALAPLAFAVMACGALSACHSSTTGSGDLGAGGVDMPTVAGQYDGRLDVDIRDKVDVTITPGEGDAIDVKLGFQPGSYGVLDPSQPLEATGRVEHFPEAATDLYTAVFSAPAFPSGMCGSQPVTLALSLARREGNARVGGGLTGYCGANVTSGTPARILRLTGSLSMVVAQ